MHLRHVFERKEKPNYKERKGLTRTVLSLLKHWYKVIDYMKHGECFQLLVSAHLNR